MIGGWEETCLHPTRLMFLSISLKGIGGGCESLTIIPSRSNHMYHMYHSGFGQSLILQVRRLHGVTRGTRAMQDHPPRHIGMQYARCRASSRQSQSQRICLDGIPWDSQIFPIDANKKQHVGICNLLMGGKCTLRLSGGYHRSHRVLMQRHQKSTDRSPWALNRTCVFNMAVFVSSCFGS